jgi:hypothetical protein
MALAQGSGELIWWPYLVAKYGLGFLFLLLPASFLQWPLSYEIGRYTLLTGESIWQGFMRLHAWFAFPLWILMLASFLWFGAFASAGGTALAQLTGFPASLGTQGRTLFWGYASIAVFFVALMTSRHLYRFIERFMLVVAVVTLLGLIAACTHASVVAQIPTFLAGVFWPQTATRLWDPKDTSSLLTAITFVGLGGFWILFYSYWLKEKGVGMARVANGTPDEAAAPLGSPPAVGWVPDTSLESPQRLATWKRFLFVDSGIGLVGNLATTLMACLLAFALLTPKGLVPEGWDIATVQSEFFALRWGAVGKALFLVVAAAFLGDTWLSTADAVSRVNTDILLNFFKRPRKRSANWWYRFFLCLLTAITCATMPLAQPGPLIVLSAVIGFVGTVTFSIALLFLNYVVLPKQLPGFAKPGKLPMVLLSLSCVTYVVLAAAYLWLKLR